MDISFKQDWMLTDQEIVQLLKLGVERVVIRRSETFASQSDITSISFLRSENNFWYVVARLSVLVMGLIQGKPCRYDLGGLGGDVIDWSDFEQMYRAAGSPVFAGGEGLSDRSHVAAVNAANIRRILAGLADTAADGEPGETADRKVYAITLRIEAGNQSTLSSVKKALDQLLAAGQADAEATLEDEGNFDEGTVERAKFATELDISVETAKFLHTHTKL